jgi:hypothetical protein
VNDEHDNSITDKDMSERFCDDWFQAPSGTDCRWCFPEAISDFEPFDDIEAEQELCRGHLAEYCGLSLAGLDRQESESRKDEE